MKPNPYMTVRAFLIFATLYPAGVWAVTAVLSAWCVRHGGYPGDPRSGIIVGLIIDLIVLMYHIPFWLELWPDDNSR